MNTEIKTTPLFKTIKTIIDAADPERLLSSGAPENEYDNESAKIAGLLTPDMNVPQIAVTIRDVMNRSFCTGFDSDTGEVSYNPGYTSDDCLGIALEIYENFGELIDLSSGKPEFRTVITKDDNPLPDADRFFGMTPEEVIESMFSETEPDGTYIGFEPYHDDCESRLMKYTLHWDRSDCDSAKASVGKMVRIIRKNAVNSSMPRSMEKFLYPLQPDYSFLVETGFVSRDELEDIPLCEEIMDGIETKKELEEDLSGAESKAHDLYVKALAKAADARIGKGLYSYELIQFTRRLYRVIELGAPRLIIDNEARNLAQAYVYHKFADPDDVWVLDINTYARELFDTGYLGGYHNRTLDDDLKAYE